MGPSEDKCGDIIRFMQKNNASLVPLKQGILRMVAKCLFTWRFIISGS